MKSTYFCFSLGFILKLIEGLFTALRMSNSVTSIRYDTNCLGLCMCVTCVIVRMCFTSVVEISHAVVSPSVYNYNEIPIPELAVPVPTPWPTMVKMTTEQTYTLIVSDHKHYASAYCYNIYIG